MHALVAQGDILHRTSSLDYFDDPQVNLDQQILHSFVQEYSVQTDLVKSILKRLFPATNRAFSNYRHNQAEVNSWFHDRRVANSELPVGATVNADEFRFKYTILEKSAEVACML